MRPLPGRCPAQLRGRHHLGSARPAARRLRRGRDEVKALAERVEGLSFPLAARHGSVAQGVTARSRRTAKCGRWRCIVDRAGKIVWTGEGASALKPAALTAAFREVAR